MSDRIACILVALLCSATFFIGYGLTPWTLGDPVDGRGDLWQACRLLKTLWGPGGRFMNSELAAPFRADHTGFPDTFVFYYPLLWCLHWVSDNVYLHYNLIIWLNFVFVGLATFAVLRRLGCWNQTSLLLAWVYSSLPNHLERYDHYGISFYATAPLIVYYAFRLIRNEHIGGGESAWALICGLSGPYYATFGCLICSFSSLLGAGLHRSKRPLLGGLRLCGLVALAFFFSVIPILLTRHPDSAWIPRRDPSDLTRWSLHLDRLVLPAHSQMMHPLHRLATQYYDIYPVAIEDNESPYLGMLGLLTGILLLGVRSSSARTLRALAILILLIGSPSGLGQLLSLVLGTIIRCYNRISFYFIFAVLAALAVEVQTVRRLRAYTAVLWLVGTVAVLEQITSVQPRQPRRWQEEIRSDRKFVGELQALLPVGSMLWQYPYIPYPEQAVAWQEGSYGLGRCYAVSKGLHWSWGALKGTDQARCHDAFSRLPLAAQIRILTDSGFAGVTLERRAFRDHGAALQSQLSALGLSATVASPDQNLVFFPLPSPRIPSFESALRFQTAVIQESGWMAGKVDFTSEGCGQLFLGTGWSLPEEDGVWTEGKQAFLRLPAHKASTGRLSLEVAPFLGKGGQQLSVYVGKELLSTSEFRSTDPQSITLFVPLPSTIRLEIGQPTQPKKGLNPEQRMLGVKLRNLQVVCGQSGD